MKPISNESLQKLLDSAKLSAQHAYCTYSNFPVGAAVITKENQIFSGCNVENISYGLTNCAERTAIFSAVNAGVKPGEIQAILLYMPGNKLYTPCGACRQVMAEFISSDSVVYATCDSDEKKTWMMGDLLPEGFSFI